MRNSIILSVSIVLLTFCFQTKAQRISGRDVVSDGSTHRYSYSGPGSIGHRYKWFFTGSDEELCPSETCTAVDITFNGSGGTISLTVMDDESETLIGMYTKSVTLYQTINVNHDSRCGPGPIELSVSNPRGRYEWYTSSSGGSPLTDGVTIDISGPGGSVLKVLDQYSTKTYYVKSLNGGGRVAARATILPLPNKYTVTGGGSYCSGEGGKPIGLDASQIGVAYQLKRGSTNVGSPVNGTGNAISFGYHTTAGTYTVKASDETTGCTSFGMLNYVSISVNPLPSLASGAGSERCGSGSITLSAMPGSNGSTIRWYSSPNGGPVLYTGKDYPISHLSSTTTYYAASYNSITRCEDTDRRAITATIHSIPGLAVGSPTERFGPGSVTLQATPGSNGNNLKWYSSKNADLSFYEGLSYTNPHLNSSTSYWVASYNSSTDCEDADRVKIEAIILPLPVISASQECVRSGQTVILNTTPGYANYQWFYNNSSVQNGASSQLDVTLPGKYKVTITSQKGAVYTTEEVIFEDQMEIEQNAIVSYHYRKSYTHEPGFETGLKDNVNVSVDFFDGLGRPVQEVIIEASPAGNDVITPIVYDNYGRIPRKYLPYVDMDKNCFLYRADAIHKQSVFYNLLHKTNVSFSERKFELTPFNRVIEQGAPGEAWQLGDATISYDYDIADAGEVILWKFESIMSDSKMSYDSPQLYKTTTTDEDGKETIVYTNKQDQTILKRSKIKSEEWADTYYIYDDYDLLRVVLPPEATHRLDDEFFGKNATERKNFLDRWAFQYDYDGIRRMIMKKVPGADPVLMVYDQWDRLVLTQDGNQRDPNTGNGVEWSFTKYDRLNRPVITGLFTQSASLSEQQVRDLVRNNTRRTEEFTGSGITQYTDFSYPTSTDGVLDYMTVTYYDNYKFVAGSGLKNTKYTRPSVLAAPNIDEFHLLPEPLDHVKGQVTGTKTRILGTDDYLESITYYDDNYRVIQAVSQNHLDAGGLDIISNQYDFTGNVRRVHSLHNNGTGQTTILLEYDYDHANRLTEGYHTMSGGYRIHLFSNEYNELGELVRKKLHGDTDDSSYAQSVDYEYNIRGWLRKINGSGLSGSQDVPEPADLFSMELIYNTTITGVPSN